MKNETAECIRQAFLDYVYQEALTEFQAGEKVNKFVHVLINNELENIVDDFFKKGQKPGFGNPG